MAQDELDVDGVDRVVEHLVLVASMGCLSSDLVERAKFKLPFAREMIARVCERANGRVPVLSRYNRFLFLPNRLL